jgi:hypothetical protein
MDIDMLGRVSNEENSVVSQIQDVLAVKVEEDGLVFNANSIEVERITGKADYDGIRIRFHGSLDVMRIKMQIDIGFGDVIYPAPEKYDLPTMLNYPPPRLLCYSRESSIAEKFEAMVKLGMLNNRMKDFYDIWLLSRYFDFSGTKLAGAIRQSFDRRGTALPSEIEAFDQTFTEVKQVQWTAFRKRIQQDHIPTSFGEIITLVDRFLRPIIVSISVGKPIPSNWKAPGPRWD